MACIFVDLGTWPKFLALQNLYSSVGIIPYGLNSSHLKSLGAEGFQTLDIVQIWEDFHGHLRYLGDGTPI